MSTVAQLHTFTFDNIKIDSIAKATISESNEFDSFLSQRDTSREIKIQSTITDDTIAQQLKEFFENERLTIVEFTTLFSENLSGLYILRSGSVKQNQGACYHNVEFQLSGKFPFRRASVGVKERDTEWDIIDEVTDGDYTQLTNYSTTGTVTDSGTYITMNASSTLMAGYDFQSDFIWEFKADLNPDTSALDIILRQIDGNHEIFIRVDSTNIEFEYHSEYTGGDYSRVFPVDQINVADYGIFKVIVAGDKISFFYNYEDDEEPEHIFTIHDSRIRVGQYGLRTNAGASAMIDDWKISQAKPTVTQTPKGARECSEIAVHSSDRYEDDKNLGNDVKTYINPRGEFTFRVFNLTGTFNDATIGNVKVYDDMNEVSESNWVEVFHPSHTFTGKIVVSNGLIRIREIDADNLYFGVYVDSTWEEINFLTMWTSVALGNIKRIITKLSPYKVVIREFGEYSGGGAEDTIWTDYIITKGNYLIQVINERGI